MGQKIVFREMLSEIKELADSQGDVLTKQEVDDFFANAHLSPEQMELVYEYLHGQRIRVIGYEPEGSAASAEAAQKKRASRDRAADGGGLAPAGMELYLREVGRIEGIAAAEELELFSLAVAGDTAAKSRLVELYLQMVCSLAGDYDGEDCPVEDLIQEGNIGLLLAVEKLEARDSLAAYQAQLMNEVSLCIQEAARVHRDVREMGQGIARRVNHLSEAIHNLEEDLGHKVSIGELSAYLEMPAEEIRAVLKMAGDELEVEGS